MLYSGTVRRAALLLWFLTLAGCVQTSPYATQPSPFGRAATNEETRLVVTNDQTTDMRIYALRGSSRHRLGVVESLSSRSLRLPQHVLAGASELRLEAVGFASRVRIELLPVIVLPGSRVDVQLGYRPWMSTVSVR